MQFSCLSTDTLNSHDLYFDISYPTLPILSRRRFMIEREKNSISRSSSSLIYSVAMIGAGTLSQYRPLQQVCYHLARKYLEMCELDDDSSDLASINVFQAFVFIIRYEITNNRLERAWMTLGRAIRLAKLLNLHRMDQVETACVDGSKLGLSLPPTDDPALLEERRRSFWGLYILESYACTRTGMPSHLGEAQVRTPLSNLYVTKV